ncbi:MAG: GAF domain-containing protein [Pseudomonadota bacterium]
MRDYETVAKTISALTAGETDAIAKMATIACELYHNLEGFDWVGFYRVVEPELLKIGPYQGGHGCLVIPFDKGVCGACARDEEVQIVDDVNAFSGHIACSSSTQSEIVLPVYEDGKLIAVLDVDSDKPADFNETDKDALNAILEASFR